jgi:acetyl-CoA carboxylase biotin carboxyl carrier protein
MSSNDGNDLTSQDPVSNLKQQSDLEQQTDGKAISKTATEWIEPFVSVLEKHQLTRLEYQQGDFKVVLERQQNLQVMQNPVATSQVTTTAADATSVTKPDISSTDYIVKAPLVGTIYSSRSPQDQAFVQVGSKVATGDILCLIEAMKCYNEITAPVDGIITNVFLANGELAEYGQALFAIDQG